MIKGFRASSHRNSLVAQEVKNPPTVWDTWVRSLDQDYPLEKEMATHSSIAGKYHGQRSTAGYSAWGHKRVKHD